ncbi:MAG: transposase [Candidatus Omnitrophica bacterium]|nr:transposase [Candidatus Omnitrophota bacterium]
MVYHVFNKSIAGFKIFNNNYDYLRMMAAVYYYQVENPAVNFSKFARSYTTKTNYLSNKASFLIGKEKLAEIIAYCLMPTHLHFILQPLREYGISIFTNNLLNSYTRYFNLKHKRKGPLWESRSKKVLVETDEQLLHLTRYVHLNPVTAYLVEKPEEWKHSSYREYIPENNDKEKLCRYEGLLHIEAGWYKGFVINGISYQRELAEIKTLLFD